MRLFVVQYVWLVFVYNLKGFGVWFCFRLRCMYYNDRSTTVTRFDVFVVFVVHGRLFVPCCSHDDGTGRVHHFCETEGARR